MRRTELEKKLYEQLLTNGLKYCPNCEKIKPITDYTRDPTKKSGLNTYCAQCKREAMREWYKNNPKPRAKQTTTPELNFNSHKALEGGSYIAITPIQTPANSDNRIDQMIEKLDTLIEGLSYFFKG